MDKNLIRILIGGAIFAAAMALEQFLDTGWLLVTLFMGSYLIVGGDVILRAGKTIFKGAVFDESFLMTIATIGAICIGSYPEATAVMLFYQVGEMFQDRAVEKSRESIAKLMDIRPDFANLKKGGETRKVDPDQVAVGELIVIKPGEKVPLDCKVVEGVSMVDTSKLTGESVPREALPGVELLSGSINLNGVLTAEVLKEFGDSTVSKILELVENSSLKKSSSERFMTKFARYYTPAVVVLAILLAVIPPLTFAPSAWSTWVYRALVFLVVSCPCALVISIPLSFFGGLGGAAKKGILFKGSNHLEALAQAKYFVFDKTGTLTKGIFRVQTVHTHGVTEKELLRYAAYAEYYSTHPISASLKHGFGEEIDPAKIENVEELAGHGVTAVVEGRKVFAGNDKLMRVKGIDYNEPANLPGTVVHVAVDGKYAGYILIADEIKEDAPKAIKELKANGVISTVMLTGDVQVVADKVAAETGIDKVYAGLLPEGKVAVLEELMKERQGGSKLVFVGDGINDAPVLARADIGVAMGGVGSDAAIEAADMVIMTDEPSKLASGIRISRKTISIARQNTTLAISVKMLVLGLSAMGLASMWAAVFSDIGVTVIAVLNAMRALQVDDV